MMDKAFARIQVAELTTLLEEVGDDPVMGPQFRERLEEAEQFLRMSDESKAPPEQTPFPRTAMFLRGDGVQGTEGIRPGLAGEILIQYEKMFREQALRSERAVAQESERTRRPRKAADPGLLFTGTPRGSFGLVFVPLSPADSSLRDVYIQSLNSVTDLLIQVASGVGTILGDTLDGVQSPVLRPMRQLLKTLGKYGVGLRVAFDDRPPQSVSASQIAKSVEQLERDVSEEQVEVLGEFRGVTLLTGHFDFMTDDSRAISGIVTEQLAYEGLDRIHDLTNHTCKASLWKTTYRPTQGIPRITYVLTDLSEVARPAASAERFLDL